MRKKSQQLKFRQYFIHSAEVTDTAKPMIAFFNLFEPSKFAVFIVTALSLTCLLVFAFFAQNSSNVESHFNGKFY